MAYIDAHKSAYGVGPICKMLPIAPSTYYAIKANERAPELRCTRVTRDEYLQAEIERAWGENLCVYGVRKVWRQLNREGIGVARCTTERLMNKLGIHGVVRGRRIKTTLPDHLAERPLDLVNRDVAADAKSFFSTRRTLKPAATRCWAELAPLIPPSMMTTSNVRPSIPASGPPVVTSSCVMASVPKEKHWRWHNDGMHVTDSYPARRGHAVPAI